MEGGREGRGEEGERVGENDPRYLHDDSSFLPLLSISDRTRRWRLLVSSLASVLCW